MSYKDKYEVYILEDKENRIEVEAVPSLGGMLTGIRVGGKELLYIKPGWEGEDDILAGGCPILFPVCGSLADDSYYHNGRRYNMPAHGFARSLPWVVEYYSEDRKKIVISLEDSEATREHYPFSFKTELTYELEGGSIKVKQEVFNRSEEELPFYTGYHPYFIGEDKSALDININAEKYIDYTTGKIEEYKGKVDFNLPVNFIFFNLTGRTHAFVNKKDGYSLTMESDESMNNLVLWTMEYVNEEYICMEPWMSKPNALNTGEGVCFVRPGESKASAVTYTAKLL